MLHEIIPKFSLSRSLQSDNGTSFTFKVTQRVSKALGITYYLHCDWRPQSSGKVERANQFLKSVIRKITQETSLEWKEALSIAFFGTHIAPKEQAGLSPCEMLYGRSFVYVKDLFLDPEAQTLHLISWLLVNSNKKYTCGVWTKSQKILKSYPLSAPGTQVLINVYKDGSPKAQLQPTWKDPYPVILSIPTSIKVPGHGTWIHYSQIKPWKKTEEDTQYTCEPLGDLRYLSRTTNECHSNEHPEN